LPQKHHYTYQQTYYRFRKISQGSLDEPVSIPGKNEISLLAQSFDIMRTKLKDSIESLQQRTRELEGLNAENARLYEQVRDKEIILTELLKNSISAQEDERKRIARELHDETSQALTTLAIGLETIVKSPPADAERLKAAMRKNQDLTIKTLEDIHRLILDLRPSVLDDLGLIPALEWYAKNRLEPEGVKVNVESSGSEKRPPPHVEVALFRMAQEAISNIAHHAQAKFASVSLDFATDAIKLTVEDDGISFNSADVLSRANGRRGLGLLGMKERAELLGGRININSQPDVGTQVSIEIPVTWKGDSIG
jgi:signal transduction histidine kinase